VHVDPEFQLVHHVAGGLFHAGNWFPHVHCDIGTCILQTNQPKQSESDEQVAHALLLEQVHCIHVDHGQHCKSVKQLVADVNQSKEKTEIKITIIYFFMTIGVAKYI